MPDRENHLTKDVFVAGSVPRITYNPRDERHLEQELDAYLDQGPGRALTVFGPTKSGKTVLIERRLPRDEAIWIEGSDVHSVDVLWDRVVDWLGLYDQVEVSRQEGEGSGRQLGGAAGPGWAKIDARKTDDTTTTKAVRKTRTQAINSVARDSLETVGTPIVIDDFHHVAEGVQRGIARAIKTLIPFCKVVLIAIPHEAFAVVRNEPDMGFRVAQLGIDPWSEEELQFIADRGFDALAIEDRDGIGRTLAANSYGAPFLMQELSYQYAAIFLGVLQTAPETVVAVEPPHWGEFFERIANRTPNAIFDELLKGPKTRGQERDRRVFRSGLTTDIYGALLHAIAQVGKPTVGYRELAKVLERDLVEVPGGQTITGSLGHMSKIAHERRGTGDAALAYKSDTLHVLDPFLLFYLRHGTWSVAKEFDQTSGQDALPEST